MMRGSLAGVFLLLCAVALAQALGINDSVNGTLSPCSKESFALDTSGAAEGSIQTINVDARNLDVHLLDSNSKVYDVCTSPCELVLSCALADEHLWTLVLSGDNEVPVDYDIVTKRADVPLKTLTSGEELEVTYQLDDEDPYVFFSVSAGTFSNLASLNVTVSPAKNVKLILANVGGIPTDEDNSCDPFESSTGTLLVSACSLVEGTWYVAVEPVAEHFTIIATIGEGDVRQVPLNDNNEQEGSDVLYSISEIDTTLYFSVKLHAATDQALEHMLNLTLLHVQGGELHAQLTTADALPYSGCDNILASCVASFACTDYVSPCVYEEMQEEGAKTVYVGVKLLRKDHEGTPARFSLIVALNGVPQAKSLSVDGVAANEAVLQNDMNYYQFHLDDDDDETYVNVYMYGDSLTRANADLYVGSERYDNDGCFTSEWSCSIHGEDEVGVCGLQLSVCQVNVEKDYFLTVAGGATADATVGFPYTLVLEKRKARDLSTDSFYEDIVLVDGGYEHFKIELDDEDAIRVSIGNVLFGEVEIYLYSEDDAFAGDDCSSGQCYEADGNAPLAVAGADGIQFVIQHCACGSPQRLSVRAMTSEENHNRPVSFTMSSIRAADGDIDIKDLDEDDRVTALIGGTNFRNDVAYYEFDASFDDNDEIVLTLTVNDFINVDEDVIEMTLFAGSGKNVFCESCARDISCTVGEEFFCSIVLQPCMYEHEELERSHVRVSAQSTTAHQFELSLQDRNLDSDTLDDGEAVIGVVGVNQYNHYRIRYPSADDEDTDLTGMYALLIELYLDQAADTTASLYVNPDDLAGEYSDCFAHVASQHGQEAIDLTVDACHITAEETYYFSVRGGSTNSRNSIHYTITARWVLEQVTLEANVPLSMALYPSQRVVHSFGVPWPTDEESGLYAAISISSVDDVGMFASFGTPETSDNSSCCFDVIRRVYVPPDSEVVVPLQECDGDDFLLLMQPETGKQIRYVALLSVSEREEVDSISLATPVDDSVASQGYHFYEVAAEEENEDDRISIKFTNVRGGTIKAYVSASGVASASSCDVTMEPCVEVHGEEDTCVVYLSGCEGGYARYFSVFGDSEDGGDIFYTIEAEEHSVTTLVDARRLDRQEVHAARPEQFLLEVPDLEAYSSLELPTVKVIISDITDATADTVTVSLGTDLCLQLDALTCESSAACVVYFPQCDFAEGDYYAVVTATQDDVEFDIEMSVVDVLVADVVTVEDEVETTEVLANNFQVFEIESPPEADGALQETTVHVYSSDEKDEFIATLDSSPVVPHCSPSLSCDIGNDCILTVSSCCLQFDGSFFLTVYNPHSTQFEINVEVERATTATVVDVSLPVVSRRVEIPPGQSYQHVFDVRDLPLSASSLSVFVQQLSNDSFASTSLYLQENALAGPESMECASGSMKQAEGQEVVGLELYHCDQLRESTYALSIMHDASSTASYLVSISVQQPEAIDLDDDDTQWIELSEDTENYVQYELQLDDIASPFSDLVITIGPLEGGELLHAALNFNYPAGNEIGFCPGHLPGSDSICTLRSVNDTCQLRASVCDFAGTYYLGIRNSGGATSVGVSPGFAEQLVTVDPISSSPRNVSRDEENFQLFRTDREVILDDESYFEAEFRTSLPDDLEVYASWGGACPLPIELECDTDMPASCYFRLYYCELPTPQTIYFAVHTSSQYSISYTLKLGNPLTLHLDDVVEGVFPGVAEPQYWSLSLSSSSIPAGSGIVIDLEAGCGDVEMRVNSGALAGGSCWIASGNRVEFSACDLQELVGMGDLSIQLEAVDDIFKLYEVPVKYRLSVSSSGIGSSGPVLPISAGSAETITQRNTAFVFTVDSLSSYSGETMLTLTLPQPLSTLYNESASLQYSFISPSDCGDASVGCVVESGERTCSFWLSACELQRHSSLFLRPALAPVGSAVTITRSNPHVRLIDASFIDYEAYTDDDDDDDGEHPHSFVVHGAVSQGHSEYYRIKQDPTHRLHLLNVTVVVETLGGEVALLSALDHPPELACTEDFCSASFSPSASAGADASRRCSLFYGQTDDEAYFTVVRSGENNADLIEYTIRFHFAVPLSRTHALYPSERLCASVPADGAMYFLADFKDVGGVSDTAFSAIEVSTVVEGVVLDVLINVDGAWATPDTLVAKLECASVEPCFLLFTCPVDRQFSLSVTASEARHSVPITVLWSEMEQRVKRMLMGVSYSSGQYFMLQFPEVDDGDMLQVDFNRGLPSQRLIADDARIPGEGSSCSQYDCTFDCQFLCEDYLFGQLMYFAVVNADVAPFSISWAVLSLPVATPLSLDDPISVSLAEDETATFELDVSHLDTYSTVEVVVYGIPQVDLRHAGQLRMWASADEHTDLSCADVDAFVEAGSGRMVIPYCILQKASSIYVSLIAFDQVSACSRVSFTLKAVQTSPSKISSVELGVPDVVTMESARDSQWLSVSVTPEDLSGANDLIDFTLNGVKGTSVAATLYPPAAADCPCSVPFRSDSLTVMPCCAVSGNYYINVVHLNPTVSAASYDVVASAVSPAALNPSEVVEVTSSEAGSARYYLASNATDAESLTISYTSKLDSAVVSLWSLSDQCEMFSPATDCSVGECSVELSWEEIRPEPSALVVKLEMNGAGASGDLVWVSGDDNCAETPSNGMCSDMSVWVGADVDSVSAMISGASDMYEHLFSQLFCQSECSCSHVSSECRNILKEYVCQLSLPVCASDGYQSTPSHKTCRDVEKRCDVSLALLAPNVACEHEWLRSDGDTTPPSPPPPPSPSNGIDTTTSTHTPSTSDTGSHEGFGTSVSSWDHTLEWVIFGVFSFFFFTILLLALVAGGTVYIRKRRSASPALYEPLEVNYD